MVQKNLFLIVVMIIGAWSLPGAVLAQTEASTSITYLVPTVIVGALVDSINPCAFSVLIISMAFLFSMGAQRRRMLSVGGAYIFGIFVVYTLIGLGILQVLSFFNITHGFAKFAAALLLALGAVNIIGYLKPALAFDMGIAGFIKPTMAKLIKGGSMPLVFLLGGLVALFEFPCTGGPYLLVLGLLHDSRTFVQGLWYLILYNIIFILPLVLILFTATQPAVLNRFDTLRHQHQAKAKLIVGAVMVVLSLIILLFY